ncbi:MAG: hypothetical protein ABWZ56_06730 [Flavobacterium sp.]
MKKEDIEILLHKYLQIIDLEINQLGFKPTEVRHLLGRMGEFYCAIETNGILATQTNQRGYDVIALNNRKISVKTTAQKTGFVTFNKRTLQLADDIMIIQYTEDGLNKIYFGASEFIIPHCRTWKENFEVDISKIKKLQLEKSQNPENKNIA